MSSSAPLEGQLHHRHKRTPSIPLRVRSTSLGDAAVVATLLSPSNAEIPSAEPFRSPTTAGANHAATLHSALPQKASEKYGFVVYVGSLVAWYLFLFWSFTPDRYIKALGIEWYPNRCVCISVLYGITTKLTFCSCREWALLIPSWIMVCVLYVYIAYFSLNLYHTPALSSMTCVTDTQGKLHPLFEGGIRQENPSAAPPPYGIRQSMSDREAEYIPPLYDLPIDLINQAMFGDNKVETPF